MRVLMVNKYAHVTGGADQNCLATLSALAERGHAVALLSTASPRNVFSEGAFLKLRITHRRRGSLGPTQRLAVAARAFWNPEAASAMKDLIRRFRPDVVHAHKLYPQISVAPIVVARRAGVPVVQTLHDYELLSASQLDHTGGSLDRDEAGITYRALNTGTFPLRRQLQTPRTSAFIACSRFVAERYRTIRGIEARVIPYFVESAPGPGLDFAQRDGAIFVGRLQEQKGVFDVIRLAELAPRIRVAVVGYGPLEQAVTDAARRLPNLTSAGERDRSQVRDLLEGARVSLMPSRWQEPGGIAALEAMSVGTPVIAYANGGLAEYVSDAGGGRAIAPSVEALTRETVALHDEPQRWRECSTRGATSVARFHSADAYLRPLLEVYESTGASSPGLG